MKSNVRAIVFHEHGAPGDVVRVEEITAGEPQAGEVRVRLLAAPINPADLNVIEGKYPNSRVGVGGIEGIGVVEAVGAGVSEMQAGDRVLLPQGYGTWREAGVMQAAGLVVVPEGVPTEQAAMLRINPPTALRMLRDFTPLRAGDWVLQNAGNSGVGHAVIQLARESGLRSVSVVRRAELVDEMRSQGADVVLPEDENLEARIAEATSRAEIRLALNAVGGDSAVRLSGALASSGTIVTYGAMARKPLRIPNGQLIFKDIRWRGFWISAWYRQASPEAVRAMYAELFELLSRGVLHSPVERIYPLSDAAAALAHAAQGRRTGKILFGGEEWFAAQRPT
jgi:trans-2-enoyl-CoA reductase